MIRLYGLGFRDLGIQGLGMEFGCLGIGDLGTYRFRV